MYEKFPVEVTDVVLTNPQALREPTTKDLITMWNHPEVLRQHLSTIPEPTVATQLAESAMRGRLALAKNLLRKVTEMKEAIAPRESPILSTAFAEKSYKRKFAIWNSFPINHLPIEILQEVFRFIILSVGDTSRVTANRLLLTSVCQFWRSVALSDKILWNTVYFDDPAPWARSLTFVERAASAKLDIRIDEPRARPRRRPVGHGSAPPTPPPSPPSITPQQMDTLLDVILSKYAQLRILIVVVNRWDTARAVMRRFADAGEAVALERFELHRGQVANLNAWIPEQHNSSEAYQPYPLCDGLTPRLSWLCLSGMNIDWKRFSPVGLTTLDLRRIPQGVLPDGDTFRRILSSSPKLRRLSMSNAGPQLESRDVAPKPVPLPALRELLLGDCSVEYATRCLAQFDAPNILCLTLLNMANVSHNGLFVYLTGRYPKVEILSTYTLDIHGTTENKAAIVKWLDSMPKLALIKVAQMPLPYVDCFMEDPRQYDAEPVEPDTEDSSQRHVIAPLLSGFHCTHMPKDAILQFINRRSRLGAPLKKFYTPQMFAELGLRAEGMKEIRDTGVNVKVMYHNMATDEEQQLLARL
ncbi:hypothetical protein BC835DRAFT_5756 [Cytidiella melzeri]|nr:hypothetical protein BC835DRAFT_5756 [Cytidiella melzeri]